MAPHSTQHHVSAKYDGIVAELANFRYLLRKFIHFSENAAREAGITPQQHQLMLGIAGFSAAGQATVSELAEFLQERHHSVVGLINRAARSGLVRRDNAPTDRRVVLVSLTPKGRTLLNRLTLQHRAEVTRLRDELLRFARRPRASARVRESAHLATHQNLDTGSHHI
ncbi:MAG: MarR family winged helix-turn-helix transcriptional regulator [Acidobacteriaceae bacterium]